MIKFFQKLKAKKGFTLVELIVVIAIIGVLAAILIPTMLGYVTSSRVQSSNSTAAEVKNSVNNWITSLDTKGYSIKRIPDAKNAFEWTITFGTAGAYTEGHVKVDGIDASKQFSDSKGAYAKDLEKKLSADYPKDKAIAKVFVVNGSVIGCVYVSGTDKLPDDAPKKENFTGTAYEWGNADGVAKTSGMIIGTSPAIVSGLGTETSEEEKA